MRGAPLKLGQALSIQEDGLVPKEIKQAFERARQSADIMPKSQVKEQLEKAWGQGYKEEIEVDLLPMAAASLGQVHKGVLKDGQAVAVKVQYPGVSTSIDSDLLNLERLMRYTGVFPKQMFLEVIIATSRKELKEECDYLHEAECQRRMF